MNILCTGCVTFTKGKLFSPHNLLFCNSKHPAHNKPQRGELTKILEKYFVCPIGQSALIDQVRSGTFTCTRNEEVEGSFSGRTTRSSQTTEPGETVYLTQWIRVGKKPQLVMYDRGSNTNLILGKVAQSGKMGIVSDRPRTMTVAGGQTLTTKYGEHRAEIGPSITGENRYLDCQGVNSIAGSLRKPSLKEVNRELRGTGFLYQSTPLPRHAAGGNVGVLVGIQDVQLDPVLIAVLPSGTCVYRCPFINIWRSQIAFAGPHPSFTAPTANSHRSSLFTKLTNKPGGPEHKKNKKREFCRNPRLCHLAPPGWSDSA